MIYRALLLISLTGLAPTTGLFQASRVDFRSIVEIKLEKKGLKLRDICPIDDDVVAKRVFKDYGAVYVAAKSVRFPDRCVFSNDDEVSVFQAGLETTSVNLGGRTIELQDVAAEALLKAVKAAGKKKLTITPRGASAARRSYGDTYRIWKSRFDPALKHWVARGRISEKAATSAAKMETPAQVAQVIEWEKDSIWFSTGFNRSIFSSVAAPGTSQHLSMFALDVAEFANKDVRAVLNQHGWFQTIIDDTPHFTYLGLEEDELAERGLIALIRNGYKFWVPNFDRNS